MMMFNLLMEFLMLIIPILISVAFLTLAERKILSYTQFRKGPNKISLGGFLQPFADAIKLFVNELITPFSSNIIIFWLSACLSIFLAMGIWTILPWNWSFMNLNYSWILFLTLISLNAYPVIFGGWSSNSKYAQIGYLRSVAQTISYEVLMTLVIFFFLIMSMSFSMMKLLHFNSYLKFLLFFPSLMILWIFSCLAETNRTPFDFTEGESELVSGFNVEFMSGLFTFYFLAEYMNIIFLSFITALLMTFSLKLINFFLFFIFYLFIWIWIRSTYPRHRYDLMMYLCWKNLMCFMMLIIIFSLTLFI